jgi:cellulose synthase/poly-beta-1,6-N-acetylglucosamine synthase-like glycosyltransferase
MLEEIGGYDPTNITEDHEIAFRIHKSKYKIKNCMDAKVYTTLPDTFKQIYVQRRRWYAGAIQTMVKHKDMLFNKKYQLFGYYLPLHYILISLGFITAVSSVYLTVNKFIREILYYKYTNFNFFDHLKFAPDFLTLSRVSILGLSLFIVTILLMVTGIIYTKKRLRDYNTGLLGYPFMFFLYQIYWGGAFFAVIKNKKIKWR